jgi:hypothetical protein
MPKPNHGTKKNPGRAKWVTRRNVHREQKRRKEANDLAAILDFKKSQPKGPS